MRYLLIPALLFAETALAESFLFTCDINGTDLKSFIYDHEKHSITYSEKFVADNQPKDGVEKFKFSNINNEYLQLDRVYTGEKHKKSGVILESVYISRFTNYINTAPVLKAKSSTFINNEYITSSSGKCKLSTRQF
jgi:hypothetical protein